MDINLVHTWAHIKPYITCEGWFSYKLHVRNHLTIGDEGLELKNIGYFTVQTEFSQ